MNRREFRIARDVVEYNTSIQQVSQVWNESPETIKRWAYQYMQMDSGVKSSVNMLLDAVDGDHRDALETIDELLGEKVMGERLNRVKALHRALEHTMKMADECEQDMPDELVVKWRKRTTDQLTKVRASVEKILDGPEAE